MAFFISIHKISLEPGRTTSLETIKLVSLIPICLLAITFYKAIRLRGFSLRSKAAQRPVSFNGWTPKGDDIDIFYINYLIYITHN